MPALAQNLIEGMEHVCQSLVEQTFAKALQSQILQSSGNTTLPILNTACQTNMAIHLVVAGSIYFWSGYLIKKAHES